MLEESIKENTASIRELGAVIALLTTAIKSATLASISTAVKATPVDESKPMSAAVKPAATTTTKPAASSVAKPAAKSATAPAAKPVETVDTDVDLSDEEFVLPEGERTLEFFMLYVAPKLTELVRQDKDAAIALISSFGKERAREIPPNKWDELYTRVQLKLQGLQA